MYICGVADVAVGKDHAEVANGVSLNKWKIENQAHQL